MKTNLHFQIGSNLRKYFSSLRIRIDLEDGRGSQEEGSHSLTFWVYFAIRAVLNIFMNASFNISVGFPYFMLSSKI